MEFKFRAGDPRPPPPPLPPPLQCASPLPSAGYCLSNQGVPDACLGQTMDIITLRKPFDTNEAMHCEMELMRLREEKLLLEIERQRFLKEEARRELMLYEREMALRGVAQSVGYSLRQPQQWGAPFIAAVAPSLPPSPAVVVQSFQEWQKMEKAKSSECLGFGAVALPPWVQPFMMEDKRERQVLQADTSKLIELEKPDPNVFREKRKAEMPSMSTDNLQSSGVRKTPTSTSTDNIQSSDVKKTPKDWLSCALCKVTVSNQKVFNEHLHGKKHKRREAGLRGPQKASQVSQAAPPEPLSNKRRKLETTVGSAGAQELKESEDGETLQGEKTEGSFIMTALIPNFLKSGEEEDDKQQNLQNLPNFLKSGEIEDDKQQDLQNFLKSGDEEDNKHQNMQNQNQNLQNFLKSSDEEDNKQQNLENQNQNMQNFLKSSDEEDNKQQNLENQNQNQNMQNFLKSSDEEDNKQQNLENQNQIVQNFLKSDDKEDYEQQIPNQMVVAQNFTVEDLVAKKKFNYWCKECKVGAYASGVMVAHLNGKKHRANLKEPDQTGKGQPL